MGASVFIVRKRGGYLEDGTILLSSELKTEEEIDLCIDDLKRNLDDVGICAKKDLRQALEQIRGKVSEKRRKS